MILAYDALQQNVIYTKLDMMQALNITIDYDSGWLEGSWSSLIARNRNERPPIQKKNTFLNQLIFN
jgi:hypothetical protein